MPRWGAQLSGPSPAACWPLKSSSGVSWMHSTTGCAAMRAMLLYGLTVATASGNSLDWLRLIYVHPSKEES